MSQRVNDGIERTPEQYFRRSITPGIPSGEVRKRIQEA